MREGRKRVDYLGGKKSEVIARDRERASAGRSLMDSGPGDERKSRDIDRGPRSPGCRSVRNSSLRRRNVAGLRRTTTREPA